MDFLKPLSLVDRGDFGDLQPSLAARGLAPFSEELPLCLPSLGDIGRVVGICILDIR